MQNYHKLERIGEGSFGRVYKGRRKFTGQTVSVTHHRVVNFNRSHASSAHWQVYNFSVVTTSTTKASYPNPAMQFVRG